MLNPVNCMLLISQWWRWIKNKQNNKINFMSISHNISNVHKQLSKGVLKNKRWSENIKQIYRKTPMAKYDFNKVGKYHTSKKEIKLRHGCSPLLQIFGTPFPMNSSGRLLLNVLNFLNINSTKHYCKTIFSK